jgi:hypothetical protein
MSHVAKSNDRAIDGKLRSAPTRVECHDVAMLVALPANIKLNLSSLLMTNTLAYFAQL